MITLQTATLIDYLVICSPLSTSLHTAALIDYLVICSPLPNPLRSCAVFGEIKNLNIE